LSTIRLKRGDVGVRFTDTLTANLEPINLTGATVLFLLRPLGASEPNVIGEATIIDADGGEVEYVSVEGDLEDSGLCRQEWEITYETGDVFTVPSESHNVVRIVGDLNPDDGS
jgi:hypothetical protein